MNKLVKEIGLVRLNVVDNLNELIKGLNELGNNLKSGNDMRKIESLNGLLEMLKMIENCTKCKVQLMRKDNNYTHKLIDQLNDQLNGRLRDSNIYREVKAELSVLSTNI